MSTKRYQHVPRQHTIRWVTFLGNSEVSSEQTLDSAKLSTAVAVLSRAFLSNTDNTFLKHFIGDGFALQERDFALKTSKSHKAILRTLAERGVLLGLLLCHARPARTREPSSRRIPGTKI